MKQLRDAVKRYQSQRDRRKLATNELDVETFTLPLTAARLKARDILDRNPGRGYVSIIEGWRQQSDGQIEFTMRRLPTAE